MTCHSSVKKPSDSGVTIIELSLVLAVLLLLASITTISATSITTWKRGREAGISLQSVYLAQKSYLADHPTKDIKDVPVEDIIKYLPNQPGALPTAESKEGDPLTIDFSQIPPVLRKGAKRYDPSDSDEDGLWDLGSL